MLPLPQYLQLNGYLPCPRVPATAASDRTIRHATATLAVASSSRSKVVVRTPSPAACLTWDRPSVSVGWRPLLGSGDCHSVAYLVAREISVTRTAIFMFWAQLKKPRSPAQRSSAARKGWARHKARTMVSEGIPALFQRNAKPLMRAEGRRDVTVIAGCL
jgi:hypothetical protein